MEKISRKKLEWLKSIGAKEFKNPMKYCVGNNYLYSEKYIKETPLEELQAKHDKRLIRKGKPIIDDSDLDR